MNVSAHAVAFFQPSALSDQRWNGALDTPPSGQVQQNMTEQWATTHFQWLAIDLAIHIAKYVIN
jgi:hypothetical protein